MNKDSKHLELARHTADHIGNISVGCLITLCERVEEENNARIAAKLEKKKKYLFGSGTFKPAMYVSLEDIISTIRGEND